MHTGTQDNCRFAAVLIRKDQVMDFNRICINCMKEKGEGETVCLNCGFNPREYKTRSYTLPPFTILHGNYLIGRVLGAGGFGITYLGMDMQLERMVAIKEFYIRNQMNRDATTTSVVTVNTETEDEERAFHTNYNKFIEEARTLAKLDKLKGIVKVYSCFEENNTAYIIMEYLEGSTLKSFVEHNGTLSWNDTVRILSPVMRSLQELHDQGILHRDISPDNLMFNEEGDVRLLDFGGAKQEYSNENRRQSSVFYMKSGYSPIEQISAEGVQGPWTDVYAMAATFYFCLCGHAPVDVTNRISNGDTKTLRGEGARVTERQEAIIMHGLAVRVHDRYPSMQAMLKDLDASIGKGAAGSRGAAGAVKPAGTRPGMTGYGTSSQGMRPGTSGYGTSGQGTRAGMSGYGTSGQGIRPGTSGYGTSGQGTRAGMSGYGTSGQGTRAGMSGYGTGGQGMRPGTSGYGMRQPGTGYVQSGYSTAPYQEEKKSSAVLVIAVISGILLALLIAAFVFRGELKEIMGFSSQQSSASGSSGKEDTVTAEVQEKEDPEKADEDNEIEIKDEAAEKPQEEAPAEENEQDAAQEAAPAEEAAEDQAEQPADQAEAPAEEAAGDEGHGQTIVIMPEAEPSNTTQQTAGTGTALPEVSVSGEALPGDGGGSAQGTQQVSGVQQQSAPAVYTDGLYQDGTRLDEYGYVMPDSNSRYLTDYDVNQLTLKGINYAKNEIYARHGRMFKSQELQTFFNGQAWYTGTIPASEEANVIIANQFNDYEQQNVRLLADREAALGMYQLD